MYNSFTTVVILLLCSTSSYGRGITAQLAQRVIQVKAIGCHVQLIDVPCALSRFSIGQAPIYVRSFSNEATTGAWMVLYGTFSSDTYKKIADK